MKNWMVFVMLIACSALQAQEQESKKVSEALKSGNVEQISGLLTANVDLTLLNEEDVFPKDQVVNKLTRFFAANKPSAFVVKHQGTSKLNDHYYIGELATAKGDYRVTYFIKKDGTSFRVSQFRVETIED